jgi:hypothetical protein
MLAPSGCPLPELIKNEGRLSWAEAQPLLASLADELAAARTEKTLPRMLSPKLVWVQADGQAQLADIALIEIASAAHPVGESDDQRALRLLREVATLALEGQSRPPDAAPATVQASLTPPVRTILDRLLGTAGSYETIGQFQTDLAATPAGLSGR